MASNKKNCPWCGIANPEDAQYCAGCGSELAANGGTARGIPASEPPKARGADAKAAPGVPKAKGRDASNGRKPARSMQMQPGFVYAGIAAVVILGYLFLKNDAAAPIVPQNASLAQSDTSSQRIASMEQYLASNPKDKEALLAYANMLHDGRLFPRAIAAYKKYLDLDPKNPDARVDMAICFFESGDAPGALVQLNKALEYSPRHQPAMFNLGIVYLNLEKVKESNDWFSRCAAIDPTTPVGARAKQLLSQHSLTNTNLQ